MSNLTGDKEMQVMAREKYGLALRLMVASIQNLQTIDLTVSVRTIIILALFEVSFYFPRFVIVTSFFSPN